MTSNSAFKAFTDEVGFWQRHLGLTDWQIDVELGDEKPCNRATTLIDSDGHSAVIVLERTWVEGATREDADENKVRRTAFHEVCEIMVDDLENGTSQLSVVEKNRARVAAHALIRRLENCLFPLRLEIEKKEKR